MYQPVRGIALRTINYSDRSSILTAWTAELGRISLLLNNSAGRESQRRRALTMPMSLFEGVVSIRPGREVSTIRDMRPALTAPSVTGHPVKATVAMFMAEVLGAVLHDSGASDTATWAFLTDIVGSLDRIEHRGDIANFPLWFLCRLTLILGVEPDFSTYKRGYALNLREGIFRAPILEGAPNHEVSDSRGNTLSVNASRVLEVLCRAKAHHLHHLRLTAAQRAQATDLAIAYLSQHLSPLPQLKTIDVLHAVLR